MAGNREPVHPTLGRGTENYRVDLDLDINSGPTAMKFSSEARSGPISPDHAPDPTNLQVHRYQIVLEIQSRAFRWKSLSYKWAVFQRLVTAGITRDDPRFRLLLVIAGVEQNPGPRMPRKSFDILVDILWAKSHGHPLNLPVWLHGAPRTCVLSVVRKLTRPLTRHDIEVMLLRSGLEPNPGPQTRQQKRAAHQAKVARKRQDKQVFAVAPDAVEAVTEVCVSRGISRAAAARVAADVVGMGLSKSAGDLPSVVPVPAVQPPHTAVAPAVARTDSVPLQLAPTGGEPSNARTAPPPVAQQPAVAAPAKPNPPTRPPPAIPKPAPPPPTNPVYTTFAASYHARVVPPPVKASVACDPDVRRARHEVRMSLTLLGQVRLCYRAAASAASAICNWWNPSRNTPPFAPQVHVPSPASADDPKPFQKQRDLEGYILSPKEEKAAMSIAGALLPVHLTTEAAIVPDADIAGHEALPDDRPVIDRGVRRTRADLRLVKVQYASTSYRRIGSWLLMPTVATALATGLLPFNPVISVLISLGAATGAYLTRTVLWETKTLLYSPHAVACVAKEYYPKTTSEVVKLTVASKLNCLSTLPIPAALALPVQAGTAFAIEAVFKSQDFQVVPGGLRWAAL